MSNQEADPASAPPASVPVAGGKGRRPAKLADAHLAALRELVAQRPVPTLAEPGARSRRARTWENIAKPHRPAPPPLDDGLG